MRIIIKNIKYIGCLFMALNHMCSLLAQDTVKLKKILLRDSLDFIDNKININTTANEFSPIPYKGGLLYVSKKPIKNQKIIFNKVYWVPDSLLSDKNYKDSNEKKLAIYLKLNSDFTPPTSNDNDILFNYKVIKKKSKSNIFEANFSDFTTDQAFAYNDSIKTIVYALESTKKYAGKTKWELWQAKILNGAMRNKKKINFEGDVADYLYPFISVTADTLFFASNRKGSLGGYDLYYVIRNAEGWDNKPISVDAVNTINDEISPSLVNDTLFFSSNRSGGLGGFDVYSSVINNKSSVVNLGYPINSNSDELNLNRINNNFYLTTNRSGNFDILGINYSPIFYKINGMLKYKNDSSLAKNQHLYIMDNDLDIIIDSVTTDSLGNYHFLAKPNRNYVITTLNQDKQSESFVFQSFPYQTTFDFTATLNGRSPKQIQDSIQSLYILTENKLKDSIISNDLRQKYIVRYGFDKNVLNDKEKLVLDSLIIKLSKIPNTFVIIGAFTDCVGSYKYNYKLSVKRAKYVVNYLINHGLSKERIVSNGYSKKYTLTPCLTRYAKSNQPNSRRAEILLSETKNTDWASLNTLKGDAFYTHINSTAFNLKNSATLRKNLPVVINPIKINKKVIANNLIGIVKKKQASIQLHKNNLEKTIPHVKPITVTKNIHLKDSIKKLEFVAALNAKKEQQLKNKLDRIKQDSIRVVKEAIAKQAQEQAIKLAHQQATKKAMLLTNEIKLKDSIKKAKLLAATNLIHLKDSIKNAEVIIALNAKKEQSFKEKIERLKQDSIRVVKEAIAKQAMLQKLEVQKQAAAESKLLAETKAKEKAKQKGIALANERRIKDSINKAKAITALNLRNENLLKAKLARAKQDSIVKAKAKAALDLIAQVTAAKKRTKDSLAAASLKTLSAKPNVIVAKSDIVSKPTVAVEEDMTKEEILKSLDILAKLKLEQERIVEYLTKRINKKPILIYVSSDSVSIEIYDNGIHDNDSVSVIYNKRIVVDKQELKVNKPIKFKLKVDKESKNNELVLVAENLGTEPPNTGVMFITEKSGRRQQVVLSTDMTHNEVIYFIRIEKQ